MLGELGHNGSELVDELLLHGGGIELLLLLHGCNRFGEERGDI